MDNFSLLKSVIDEVNAMAEKMCSGLIIDAAKAMPPEEVRKAIVAAALREVKFSGGSKRRAALRELDKVVRRYYPPVESAPRPSTELAHVADVFPGQTIGGSAALYYCDYIPYFPNIETLRLYENPQYSHNKRR